MSVYKKNQISFEENHLHSTYSDGLNNLEEIFNYNNIHDKLNLFITDHVNQDTLWFDKYVDEIRLLRKKYRDFEAKIGCEVKVLDIKGNLNTTEKILRSAEVVVGSVHYFEGYKALSAEHFLQQEIKLSEALIRSGKIDILGHPFGMSASLHKLSPSPKNIKHIYALCVKNKIKFEYNDKYAGKQIREFVRQEIKKGNIDNFSFGSDVHHCDEIGRSAFSMASPICVLITGAGAGVGQSLIKSLKLSKLKLKLVVVDANSSAAGLYRGDAAYIVPFAAQEKPYLNRIINICKKENVDILFVGTDTELPFFAKNKKKIERKTGSIVVVSPKRAIKIADNKWLTSKFLERNGFPFPKSCFKDNLEKFLEETKFPLIVKPQIGARSIGAGKVENKDELLSRIRELGNPLIQEYLLPEDEEYTCGTFFFNGRNYGVIVAKRWLRGGDTYKAIFHRDPKLEKFIARVGKKLKIYGPCNFQLRKTKRGPVIFEINCRFSGTTGAASYLGFNVINALLQKIFFNRPLKQLSFGESYMFRFWNEVFVDLKQLTKINKKSELERPLSGINTF